MGDRSTSLMASLINKSNVVIDPSTEDKQDTMITNQENDVLIQAQIILQQSDQIDNQETIIALIDSVSSPLGAYTTQAFDDFTTTGVSYVCKMDDNGIWLFTKIDETGDFALFTYANVSNNGTLTNYALAYAARTTATYETINELTL